MKETPRISPLSAPIAKDRTSKNSNEEINGEKSRSDFSKFIDVSWTWFMCPIVATKEPLVNYNYVSGSCPISESIGPDMVNIPCNIKKNEQQKILIKVKSALS